MAEATKSQLSSIFSNTLAPNPVTSYTLFRGVTDYTNLAQFDLYETGYSFLVLLQMPYFMDKLQENNDDYRSLITNYRHIIEYEFRGAQGIEDITGETSPLQNGITDVNIITKVTEQGGSSFSMNYFERSGSVITKTHELFLRGIKDPKTQVKRYNGLLKSPLTLRNRALANYDANTRWTHVSETNNEISDGTNTVNMKDKGYQYEIYNFLLMVTDNTALNIEKAYILASCQPTLANTSIYNVTRGDIQFSEMNLQFNGIPLPGRAVNARAQDFLNYINKYTCFDEMDYGFEIFGEVGHPEVWAGKNDMMSHTDVDGVKLTTDTAPGTSTFDFMTRNVIASSKIWRPTVKGDLSKMIDYKVDPSTDPFNSKRK